jgi:hypothetical protein
VGSRSRRRERAEEAAAPAKRKPAKAHGAKGAASAKGNGAAKRAGSADGGTASGDEALRRAYARGRERDEAARAALEPLAPGERPTAVTVAAIVAAVLAFANVAAGLLISDVDSGQIPVAVLQALVLLVAAVGMWKAKYWAVLGFQALLAIQILLLSLALLTVESPIYAIGVAVAIGLLGWLFVKLIRAMARLQMPERPR